MTRFYFLSAFCFRRLSKSEQNNIIIDHKIDDRIVQKRHLLLVQWLLAESAKIVLICDDFQKERKNKRFTIMIDKRQQQLHR